MHIAAYHGNQEIIQLLFARGHAVLYYDMTRMKRRRSTLLRFIAIERPSIFCWTPANPVRGTANTHHCAGHRKPMCKSCEASKGRLHTLAVCCYEHHRDDDGCPPIWDFCGSHRLTRCGKCIHNPTRPQLAYCCRNHHAQVGQRRISNMFAPRARPAEGADPNNRDPADARVGGTPHTVMGMVSRPSRPRTI